MREAAKPVTKRELDSAFGKLDGKMGKLETKMDKMKGEILHHFDAVAENIHQDVAGANKDEISLLKDVSKQHGQRLTRVEKKVGVR